MQTKRSKVTEKDVERWCKLWLKLQKDGIYKPWLEVREVPSLGRSRKVKGIKTHHTHHFLSDIEYHIYLMLEYNPAVIAIYEQYPLLPREDSIEIANEMGIRHPVYPQSKTPIVSSPA
ncbi:TnsA endonuclease N-terminal domain-containing protein [Endozoicomonas atrinae]|uniref:TnsA endonuclease N-terminal domain-containing protein n=1 Tax=Endozoicomonas atrinae TaxID=1333660 RepID=UPI0008268419|nr:TnsA endonuclease N-terminal domain-containing protein [Endozoicomonas atrinae]